MTGQTPVKTRRFPSSSCLFSTQTNAKSADPHKTGLEIQLLTQRPGLLGLRRRSHEIHTACTSARRTHFHHIPHMNGVKTHLPICNHSNIQNCQCEHSYSLPIYFAFHMPFRMRDTHFWYAMTLVCVCVDALGVHWGSLTFRSG